MKILKLLLLILIINTSNLFSNEARGFIDTVFAYHFTQTQTIGQGSEYFPKNIFGPPCRIASAQMQAAADSDVVSIGKKGWLIVGFKDKYVVDKEGPDFTIFENPFLNNATQKVFAEPAKVEVSQDGINYIEFPYDEKTLEGCAGVRPVYGKKDPFDPTQSGGDRFDLKDLGLKYIKYIKITDISEIVSKYPGSKYYQPEGLVLGFDLDAVAGLHLSDKPTDILEESDNFEIIQSGNDLLINNSLNTNCKVRLISYYGKEIFKKEFFNTGTIAINNLKQGVYIITVNSGKYHKYKKVLIR
jgi:hypothetical protein